MNTCYLSSDSQVVSFLSVILLPEIHPVCRGSLWVLRSRGKVAPSGRRVGRAKKGRERKLREPLPLECVDGIVDYENR